MAAMLGAMVVFAATAATAGTLDDVRAKGFVQCGVNPGLQGFASADSGGNWKGMDVDVCRAVAAAIFDAPDKVKFTPLPAKQRFEALRSGEVDILSLNTSWTMQRDTSLGLRFTAVTYYDGQGFMVRKKFGIASALELSGVTICAQGGAGGRLDITDFFRTNKMPFDPIVLETADEAYRAYDAGRCDVLTADVSRLYAARLRLTNPDEHMVLPEIVSKEPLGPVVRKGDEQWFDLVKWTIFAMINAEELGVSSENVDAMRASKSPSVRRLLGLEDDLGKKLGLDNAWAHRIIKHVGNYAEVFDRNIGSGSTLKIARGVNALWTDGGILYAPPIR